MELQSTSYVHGLACAGTSATEIIEKGFVNSFFCTDVVENKKTLRTTFDVQGLCVLICAVTVYVCVVYRQFKKLRVSKSDCSPLPL